MTYCDAPITRRQSNHNFCRRPAGEGTDHKGEGRCYRHGGGQASEVVRKHAPTLEAAARELGTGDLQALFDMSNQGLVLARALAVQRLLNPGIVTREASDLTMAISRIDKVLEKFDLEQLDEPGEANPMDEEYSRLAAIAAIEGVRTNDTTDGDKRQAATD